jgi:hypothetical protein
MTAKLTERQRRFVEELPVASLVPYANNARTHSDELADLLASRTYVGFVFCLTTIIIWCNVARHVQYIEVKG